MVLTPEQIADMRSIAGGVKSTLTPEQIADMRSISGLGTIPFNPSKGEIVKGMAQQYLGGNTPESAPDTGFFASQRQRGADLANAVNATSSAPTSSQQTPGETAAQFLLHNVAGGAGDVAGVAGRAGLSMAGDMTPDLIKNLAGSAGQYIAQSPVGQKAAELAQAYKQNEATFNEQNPRAARNFQAAKDSANLLPLKIPGATEAISAAADLAAPALKNVAVDTAMYAPRGVQTLGKGLTAAGEASRNATEEALKAGASATYDALDAKNIALAPSGSQKIFDNIRQNLSDSGIQGLNPSVHPNTDATVKDLGKWINSPAGTVAAIPEGGVDTAVGAIKKSGVGEISLKELDNYRQQLAGASYSNPKDVAAAASVRSAIDDAIHPDTSKFTANDLTSGTPQDMGLLKQAQREWTAKSQYETINDILTKAEGDPAKIKKGLNSFLQNDKKTIGWSQDKLDALSNAAKYSTVEGIYNGLGKFGFQPKKALGYLEGGAAFIPGAAPAALTMLGTGTIANQLGKYMARGKAQQLLDVIAQGKIPKEIFTDLPVPVAKDIIEQIKGNKQ